MKNNKILALALSVSMCLSLCPISVFAEDMTPGTDLTAETDESHPDAAKDSDDQQENSDIAQTEDEQLVQSDSGSDTENEITDIVSDGEEEEKADSATSPDTLKAEDEAAMLSDETSGTCGENLTWTISDGVLTISGTGEMTDYGYLSDWHGSEDITSIVIEEGVTSIGTFAFCRCTSCREIQIPSTVISIGEYAFYDCESLTGIELPEGINELADYTFAGCSSLTSVNIPVSVSKLGSDVFYRCKGLTSVIIPETVNSIGTYAFCGCNNLKELILPSGLEEIEAGLCEDCTALEKITVPETVTVISSSAFYGCSSLKEINLPAGLKTIGSRAFYKDISLKSVTLPEQLESVGDYAFNWCRNLYLFRILNKDTAFGKNVFERCNDPVLSCEADSTAADYAEEYGYERVEPDTDVPEPEQSIETDSSGKCGKNVFWSLSEDGTLTISGTGEMEDFESIGYTSWYDRHSEIKKVVVEEGVTSIGDYAFAQYVFRDGPTIWCPENPTKISEVILPESLERIGRDAFYYCDLLENINFPEGLKIIGNSAFSRCLSLQEVYCPDSLTMIGSYAFNSCSNLTILCNSGSTAEAYAIENSIKYVIYGKPVISQQPENCTAGVKHQAVFSLSAENAVSYQWQYSKNGTKWYNSSASGAKTDALTVNVSTSNYKNIYRCKLTGESGIVVYSDTATVDLIPGAKITAQPVSVCVLSGEKASFTVAADNATAYQWFYSKDGGTNWFKSTASGADTETLNVTVSSSNKNNLYKCKITGTDENVISSSKVGLVVIAAQPDNSTAAIGTTGTFTVKTDSTNPIDTYKWYYSKDSGATWYASTSTGSNTDTLSVKATTANRTNLYRCKVTSSAGLTGWTTAAGFTDSTDIVKITEQPVSVSASVGDKVSFAVTAENAAETGGYQWYYSKDGKTWYKSGASGNATDTLTITVISTNKSNQYKCKVTGTDGTSVTSDIVSVQ